MKFFLSKKGIMVGIFLAFFSVAVLFMFVLSEEKMEFSDNFSFSGASAQDCVPEYDHYNLLPGAYRYPVKGSRGDGEDFDGHTVYRYMFPNCPDRNTSDRPVLFDLDKNGHLTVGENFVIGGDKTFLLGSPEGRQGKNKWISFRKETAGTGQIDPGINLNPENSDVYLGGTAIFTGGYSNGVSDDMDLGSSLFLNKEYSRINLEGVDSVSLGPRYNQGIVETDFDPDNPVWKKHTWEEHKLEGEYGGIDHPQSKSYPVSFEKHGDYIYLADRGKRRITRYNLETEEFVDLGADNWNWAPNGVTVDGTDIYVTDSLQDRVIKTKIDGSGWQNTSQLENSYFEKLVLPPEEEEFLSAGIADGHHRHKVRTEGSNLIDRDFKLFGDYSLNFNGGSKLEIPDHSDWKFGKGARGPLVFDFWVRFNSAEESQTFFSKKGSYEFKWLHEDDGGPALALSLNEREGEHDSSEEVFKVEAEPEVGEVYNVTVVFTNFEGKNNFSIYVDDEKAGESFESNSHLVDLGNDLVIGADSESSDHLRANIDNFKVIRGYKETLQYLDSQLLGHDKWVDMNLTKDWVLTNRDINEVTNEKTDYSFNNPQGIISAGNYLYIVDNGNDRLVRMHKNNMYDWDTFGSSGSGNYQFNNPTRIYYEQLDSEDKGYLYIVDEGNDRIVKTDAATSSRKFKNHDFSEASWEELNLEHFYETLDRNRHINSDFKSKTVYHKYFNSFRSSSWSTDLSSHIDHMPYENSNLKVVIKGSGTFNVSLTDNDSFNLTETWSGDNDILSFRLPDNFILGEDSNDLDLNIGGGGQIKFVKVILSKELKPGGIHIDEEGNLYIADKNNGSIVWCGEGAKNMNCNDAWVGGQHNPQEKEQANIDELEKQRHWHNLTAPQDVYVSGVENPRVFILEGISDKDMEITSGAVGKMK